MKHIIVTVSDRQNTFSCDMEAPVDLACIKSATGGKAFLS